MSWNLDSSKERLCSCKKGQYSIHQFSNDWDQENQVWTLHCKLCSNKYIEYRWEYYQSGTSSYTLGWVEKRTKNEIDSIIKEHQELAEKTIDYTKSLYLEAWLSYFSNNKTKKSIYEKVNKLLDLNISLSVFYKRANNINDYLSELITINDLQKILTILNIVDDEILKNLDKINVLLVRKKQVEDKLKQEKYQYTH